MQSTLSTPHPRNNAVIASTCVSEAEVMPVENDQQAHFESLMTQALTIAHNTPDVRKDRVEAIRAQIAKGEYEIDADRIAESLIRENPALFED